MDEYMIKAVVDRHNQQMAKSKPVQKSKVQKDYAIVYDYSNNGDGGNCLDSVKDTATGIANYVAIRHTWVDAIDVYLEDDRATVLIRGIETDERFKIDIDIRADEWIRVFASDYRKGTFGRNDYEKVFNSESDVEAFLDECLEEYSSGYGYEASAKKSKAKKSKVQKDDKAQFWSDLELLKQKAKVVQGYLNDDIARESISDYRTLIGVVASNCRYMLELGSEMLDIISSEDN